MSALALVFTTVTASLQLPVGLISAVCHVESNHKIHVVNYDDGGEDSLGMCQIKLSTARMVGFKGTREDLMEPIVNAYYAGRYLRMQIRRYDNYIPYGVAAYNAGKLKLTPSKKIVNVKYVDKVFRAWTDGK